MNEWRERLVTELAEVTEKIVKLRRFMSTAKFFEGVTEYQADLMRLQSFHMSEYADILTKRLDVEATEE